MKHKGSERNRSAPWRSKDGSPRRASSRDSQKQDGPPDRPANAVIYGVLPVLEALRAANRRIEKVLIAEGAKYNRLNEIFDLCRERSVVWEKAPREVFAKYSDPAANHQGVIALVAAASYTDIDDILANGSEAPLLLLLDGVEDPRNLGAILRVAECSGVDGVIIPERRAVGLTDTVAKASAGAIELVKVAKSHNLNRTIEELKKRDVWVVGTSMDTATSYEDWDWTRSSALVLGGEGKGLHRLIAENCDALVKIPMYGKIDSLNVSVAAGVILFEARRQRSKG